MNTQCFINNRTYALLAALLSFSNKNTEHWIIPFFKIIKFSPPASEPVWKNDHARLHLTSQLQNWQLSYFSYPPWILVYLNPHLLITCSVLCTIRDTEMTEMPIRALNWSMTPNSAMIQSNSRLNPICVWRTTKTKQKNGNIKDIEYCDYFYKEAILLGRKQF